MVNYGALPVKATISYPTRAYYTWYANTSGRPILVIIYLRAILPNPNGEAYVIVKFASNPMLNRAGFGVANVGGISPQGSFDGTVSFMVENDESYSVADYKAGGGYVVIDEWIEVVL